ncbi:hypothetical protein [Thermodesulfobium acidiphilum]|uniref:hypothetical protein n=1 Tax=Thermodesulfobium acidiphilum TaxID=1794699 RepID=UPI000D3B5AF7|nr:hypothetical protein [Thermodesulfobium acidiphilum]
MRGIRRGNPRHIGWHRYPYGNTFISDRSSIVLLIFFIGLIISLVMGKIELVVGWTIVFLFLWFLRFFRL